MNAHNLVQQFLAAEVREEELDKLLYELSEKRSAVVEQEGHDEEFQYIVNAISAAYCEWNSLRKTEAERYQAIGKALVDAAR